MVRRWIGKFNVHRSVIWYRIWNSVLIHVSPSTLVSRHRFCCISPRWAHSKMTRNWRQKVFSKWRKENGAPAKWVRLLAILRPFGTVQNKWNSFSMKNRFRLTGVQVAYANWLMYDEHTKNSMIAKLTTARKMMNRNPFLDYYSSQSSELGRWKRKVQPNCFPLNCSCNRIRNWSKSEGVNVIWSKNVTCSKFAGNLWARWAFGAFILTIFINWISL